MRAEDGSVLLDNRKPSSVASPASPPKAAPAGQVLKIYLKNGSYLTLLVEQDYTAKDLADAIADKLNMSKFSAYLDVLEIQRGQERVLEPSANMLLVKKRWPLILGATGNETELQCRFAVIPKRGSPEQVTMLYRAAMYGTDRA